MSTEKTATTIDCPTCKKPVVWSEQSRHRPFCSKRCQQIDFGDWASENLRIPGTPTITEGMDDEEMTQH